MKAYKGKGEELKWVRSEVAHFDVECTNLLRSASCLDHPSYVI